VNATARISIYHWLPLAENMLPDIARHAREIPVYRVQDLQLVPDAVEYRSDFPITRNSQPLTVLPFRGKIDGEGFCQHVAELAPIPELSLSAALSAAVPTFRDFLAQFLFDLAPAAIRNKLAVLQEGIVSYSHFYYAEPFKPTIDDPAKAFLAKHHLAIIVLDDTHAADLKSGLVVPALNLRVPATATPCVSVNDSHNSLLFFGVDYHDEEKQLLDGLFHKLACLMNLADVGGRVISILKDTRDHVVPLRRQLAISLQRNTEEHFALLTEMKKYLTYANVKLPVVQKVLNHLSDTRGSGQFKPIGELFSKKEKTNHFKTIAMLNMHDDQIVKPLALVSRLDEDLTRLKALYEEDERELTVLSNEVSQVLQGSLSSEGVHLSARKLDTQQASLELERANKNRANALKILSVVLSASMGTTIAEWTHLRYRALVAIGFTILAGAIIEWYIRRKSCYYRLVIPLNWKVSRESLFKLLERQKLKRSESNGSRRIRTWSQRIRAGYPPPDSVIQKVKVRLSDWMQRTARDRPVQSIRRLLDPDHGRQYFADVTVDYEQRGFLHSVTIEIEASSISIDSGAVVAQMLNKFAEFGCLVEERDRKSVLADAFSRLDLLIDMSLTSLNWVLTQEPENLQRVLDLQVYKKASGDDEMAGEFGGDKLAEYKEYADDVILKCNLYRDWLGTALRCTSDNGTLATLLGKDTLSSKLAIISGLELNKN